MFSHFAAPGSWFQKVGFLGVGGLAALDFERAFRLFHGIVFPGQDNWLFSVYEDPVILILPEAFFRNCAILILALIVIWVYRADRSRLLDR